MTSILTIEQIRWIVISTLSALLSFFTPTATFVESLIIMFGFNVWAGMRADGITIIRCRNFSISKFHKALVELLLYLCILFVVFSVMKLCGDEGASLIAIKTLTYIFEYVYLQNAFKNLLIAYPHEKALHFVYHVIRLEFYRAMPKNIADIIERYDKSQEEKKGDE